MKGITDYPLLPETGLTFSMYDNIEAGTSVLFSDIVPLLEGNYILLQLSSESTAFQFTLEKGEKNSICTLISLYKNGILSDNCILRERLTWRLGFFAPGSYSFHSSQGMCLFSFSIERT